MPIKKNHFSTYVYKNKVQNLPELQIVWFYEQDCRLYIEVSKKKFTCALHWNLANLCFRQIFRSFSLFASHSCLAG